MQTLIKILKALMSIVGYAIVIAVMTVIVKMSWYIIRFFWNLV